jgi:hypothetical protein
MVGSFMKMAVFWIVAPAMIALMMETVRTSETLVNFYQTTRRYNPEDSHLRTHRRENLKSYLGFFVIDGLKIIFDTAFASVIF